MVSLTYLEGLQGGLDLNVVMGCGQDILRRTRADRRRDGRAVTLLQADMKVDGNQWTRCSESTEWEWKEWNQASQSEGTWPQQQKIKPTEQARWETHQPPRCLLKDTHVLPKAQCVNTWGLSSWRFSLPAGWSSNQGNFHPEHSFPQGERDGDAQGKVPPPHTGRTRNSSLQTPQVS